MSDPVTPVLSAVPVFNNTTLKAEFDASAAALAAAVEAQLLIDAAQDDRLDDIEAELAED